MGDVRLPSTSRTIATICCADQLKSKERGKKTSEIKCWKRAEYQWGVVEGMNGKANQINS
jgi:hypothetical protein